MPAFLPRAVLVAAFGGLAAWLVLAVSIAGVMRTSNPAVALRWAPRDAAAGANQAVLALAGDPSETVAGLARATAQDALRRDPTVGAAIRVFAMIATARGDDATAFDLYSGAEQLSRRDQAAQLWLIQYYSRRGDGEAAVHHFDTALRTSERNWGTLLNFMAMASADQRLLVPLAGLLAERPPWRANFMQDLVARGPRLEHVVALTHGRLDPAVRGERTIIQALIDRLVTASRLDLAWQVYAAIPRASVGSARPGAVRDGGFEQADGFAPFDWALVDEADLWARRDTRADGGEGAALSLFASNGRSGEVARQLIRLDPGSYALQAEAGQLPMDQAGRPTFTITCVGTGAPLLSFRPRAAGAGPVRVDGRFSVPASCGWQTVAVRIDGDISPSGAPWIDNMAIRRISS